MIDLATLQIPLVTFAIVALISMLRTALLAKFPGADDKIRDFTIVVAVGLGMLLNVGYAFLLGPNPDLRSALGIGIITGLTASGGYKMFKDLATQVRGSNG